MCIPVTLSFQRPVAPSNTFTNPNFALTLTYKPLPFDEGVLLGTPNFMARSARWHPGHDGQLSLCVSCVANSQIFRLYRGPMAGPKLLLQSRLGIWERCRALLQSLRACTVMDLEEPACQLLQMACLRAAATADTVGSAGSHGPSGRADLMEPCMSCRILSHSGPNWTW